MCNNNIAIKLNENIRDRLICDATNGFKGLMDNISGSDTVDVLTIASGLRAKEIISLIIDSI
jgi:hypothetical protein